MDHQRERAIQLASQWLTESGIVETDDQHPAYGGVYLGVHRPRGAYPKVHHRITGYGLSMFTALHRRRLNAGDLELAHQAAAYLNRHRKLDGYPLVYGACDHAYLPDLLKPAEYYLSFDNAMIIQGLCDLYRQTKVEDLLDMAMDIGSWLVENMQRPDGGFYARVDLARRKLGQAGPTFECDGGCQHAKHAIGLLRLHRLCGDQRFAAAARDVLRWVLGLQRSDGLFWANEKERYVFTHAHCHAVEGLLFGAIILEDDTLFRAAGKAVDALLNLQFEDGSLPAVPEEGRSLPLKALNIIMPYKATDATAQAMRLWLLMYEIGRDERHLAAARKAETYLLGVQVREEGGKRFSGAFHYQEAETSIGLHVRSMLYTWVTQFSLSALYWMHDRENGTAALQTYLRELF